MVHDVIFRDVSTLYPYFDHLRYIFKYFTLLSYTLR